MKFRSPIVLDSDERSELARVLHLLGNRLEASEASTGGGLPSEARLAADSGSASLPESGSQETTEVTIDEPPLFHNRETGELSIRVSNDLLDETPLGQFNQFNVGVNDQEQALAFAPPTETRIDRFDVLGQISITRSDSMTKIPIPRQAGIFTETDRPEKLTITDGHLEVYKLDQSEIEDLDTRLEQSAPTVSTDDGEVDLDTADADIESSTQQIDPDSDLDPGDSASVSPEDLSYPVFEVVTVTWENQSHRVELPETIVQASAFDRGDRASEYGYFESTNVRLTKNVEIEGYGEFDLAEHPVGYFDEGQKPEGYVYIAVVKLSTKLSIPDMYDFEEGQDLTLMVTQEGGGIHLRPGNWDSEAEDVLCEVAQGQTESETEQAAGQRELKLDAEPDTDPESEEDPSIGHAIEEVMGAEAAEESTEETAEEGNRTGKNDGGGEGDEGSEDEPDAGSEEDSKGSTTDGSDRTTETGTEAETEPELYTIAEEVTIEKNVKGSYFVPVSDAIIDAAQIARGDPLSVYTDFGETFSTGGFYDLEQYGQLSLGEHPAEYYQPDGTAPTEGLQYIGQAKANEKMAVPRAYGLSVGDRVLVAVEADTETITVTVNE